MMPLLTNAVVDSECRGSLLAQLRTQAQLAVFDTAWLADNRLLLCSLFTATKHPFIWLSSTEDKSLQHLLRRPQRELIPPSHFYTHHRPPDRAYSVIKFTYRTQNQCTRRTITVSCDEKVIYKLNLSIHLGRPSISVGALSAISPEAVELAIMAESHRGARNSSLVSYRRNGKLFSCEPVSQLTQADYA